MPMQVTKTGLLSKLGNRAVQAAEATKNKETDSNVGQLPAGIKGGIAQLKGIKFKELKPGSKDYMAGETRILFMAHGICKSPKIAKDPNTGQVVETSGLRTFIQEPLWDTPDKKRKTLESVPEKGEVGHLEFVQDIMKNLVGSPPPDGTAEREEWASMFDLAHLESTAAMLEAAGSKPDDPLHFRFETYSMPKQVIKQLQNGEFWLCNEKRDANGNVVSYDPVKGKGPYKTEEIAKKMNKYAGNEPYVNHRWGRACEWSEGDVHPSEAGTQDNSAASQELNGEMAHEPIEAPTVESGGEAQVPDAETGEVKGELPEDLESLVALANEEMGNPQPGYEVGGPACAKLLEMAAAVGIDDETAGSTEKWEDLAAMIEAVLGSQVESQMGEPAEAAVEVEAQQEPEPEPEPEPAPPPVVNKPAVVAPKPAPKPVAASTKPAPTPAKPATKPAAAIPPAKAKQPQPAPTQEPVKGEVWSYQVVDAEGKVVLGKDKKPAKPVRVEIMLVDKKSKSCTLKNMEDKKTTYLKVPWSRIKPI